MRLRWLVWMLCTTALVVVSGAAAVVAAAEAPHCDDTFVGGEHPESWGTEMNWSSMHIPGPTEFACIPAAYGHLVNFNLSSESENPAHIEGLSAESTAGFQETGSNLHLTDPTKHSLIDDLQVVGDGHITVAANDVLTLPGTSTLGGTFTGLEGPGTVEIPKGATADFVERGIGLGEGVQVLNSGTIVLGLGGGPELDSGTSGSSARIINGGKIEMTASVEIGGGERELPPGELVNESKGTILVSHNMTDGALLVNRGKVKLSKGVVMEVPPPTTVGTIDVDAGELIVEGPYEPNLASKPVIVLEIGKPTTKKHVEEQHVGVLRVKYNLDAGGTTLELKTPSSFKPPLGAVYTVLTKYERGYSGEFTLKKQCLAQDAGEHVGYVPTYGLPGPGPGETHMTLTVKENAPGC